MSSRNSTFLQLSMGCPSQHRGNGRTNTDERMSSSCHYGAGSRRVHQSNPTFFVLLRDVPRARQRSSKARQCPTRPGATENASMSSARKLPGGVGGDVGIAGERAAEMVGAAAAPARPNRWSRPPRLRVLPPPQRSKLHPCRPRPWMEDSHHSRRALPLAPTLAAPDGPFGPHGCDRQRTLRATRGLGGV